MVPIALLIVGSVGYSLVIGSFTQIWERIELLNDGLLVLVMLVSGALVPLSWTPTAMAAIGRLLPITHPIVALRSVLIDGDPIAVHENAGLLWMTLVAVAWLALGAVALHIGDTTGAPQRNPPPLLSASDMNDEDRTGPFPRKQFLTALWRHRRGPDARSSRGGVTCGQGRYPA